MNMHATFKTDFVAPAVATPLPKTEAQNPPTFPCSRRVLPFPAIAAFAGLAASKPRGRWDSDRTVGHELFTAKQPAKSAGNTGPTQLELYFA